jgi:hypothetical protein
VSKIRSAKKIMHAAMLDFIRLFMKFYFLKSYIAYITQQIIETKKIDLDGNESFGIPSRPTECSGIKNLSKPTADLV